MRQHDEHAGHSDHLEDKGRSEDRVLRALYRLIADRSLVPGSQLRQEDLAEAAGVSRLPVRQVLTRLSAEGLVRMVPNRGAFLVDISVSELRELHAVRELLEDEALRLAVERVTPEDIVVVEERLIAVEQAMTSQAVDEVARLNQAFHMAILDLSGNSYLVRVIHRCWTVVIPYRMAYLGGHSRWGQLATHHRSIFEALRDRNLERLLSVSREHRDLFVSELIPWLQVERPSPTRGRRPVPEALEPQTVPGGGAP